MEEIMRFSLKHAALVAACMAAFPAHATNGYFLPGFGIRSQGMGGVGIAYGRDSLSTAANPANAVNTGMRGDIGFAVFNPERSARQYDAATNTSPSFFPPPGVNTTSDSRYFIVPEMGFTMPLDDKLHVGMAVVGNGGMNTNFPDQLFNLGTPADVAYGVDMMQLLVPITAAYKINENHAFGASLVLAETRFRAYGLDTFLNFDISADEAHLTGNGFDYSYGAGVKLGWLGEFMDDKLTVGLTYASRTWMTKLDKYRGLFAEQGDFDIPENYGIGIALKPAKNLVIAADVLRINYADIASIGNRGPGINPDGFGPLLGIPRIDTAATLGLCPTNPYCLGNDQGMGFGWESMTVYKLGVQYGVNSRLQVRAGLNYSKTPIPNDQLAFNTAAPATVERHYSVGFTYKANENLEVSGTYMYVAPNTQKACEQNILDCVEIGMHQNVFGMSLAWVLDPSEKSMEEYGEDDWAGINFDGWYGGFNFGQSKYRGVEEDTANTRTEGWKVYGGYQFNKYVGVEGGYVNLNDMTGTTGAVVTNIDTDAWALGAVLSYPVTDKLSVMGKLGAAYMLADTDTKNGALVTVRSGDDAFEPNYGVGVSYALLDFLSVRAEWERFDRDDHDIDLMTAGMVMKF
jgi:long-chain fatty acid transport protein